MPYTISSLTRQTAETYGLSEAESRRLRERIDRRIHLDWIDRGDEATAERIADQEAQRIQAHRAEAEARRGYAVATRTPGGALRVFCADRLPLSNLLLPDWFEANERLRDLKAKPEAGYTVFHVQAEPDHQNPGEWRFTEVPGHGVDNWRPIGGVEPAGDMDPDIVGNDSYSIRYQRPPGHGGKQYAEITVSFCAIDVTCENGDEEYAVRRLTEWRTFTDPEDRDGSLVWEDTAEETLWAPGGGAYESTAEAETTAQTMAATYTNQDIGWNGIPDADSKTATWGPGQPSDNGHTFATVNPETTSLSETHAALTAWSAGAQHAITSLETAIANLTSREVGDSVIEPIREAQQAFGVAQVAFERATAALAPAAQIGDAYAATPDAGSREFVAGTNQPPAADARSERTAT